MAIGVLSTAFYYDMVNIMIRFAGIINNKKDIAYFKNEAAKIKVAFNKKFFNSTHNYYANNTTTANVLALAFNLVQDNFRKEVFARVVDKTVNDGKGHITTGLIGIQQLMRTLTHNGRPDIAYLLATTTSYPSWGYMLTQGATSIWELWNGNTAGPAMNSANHVMMIGDLLTWYYEDLAGIKAAAPAFKIIEMKPIAAPDLKFVNASYQCPQGLIVSNRSMDANGFKWQIEIPANTKAVVYIPAISSAKIKENGTPVNLLKDIKQVGKTTEYVLLKIGSGKYNFSVE
jgi:alpha-L-rhamnosidase